MTASAPPLRRRRSDRRTERGGRVLQGVATLVMLVVFLGVATGNMSVDMDLGMHATPLGGAVSSREFRVLLLVGVVMTLLLPMLSPIGGSVLTFLCMLPVYWLGFDSVQRPPIPMEYSLLTILALFVLHVLLSWFREVKRKQDVIDIFGQYVPPALAARLGRDPHARDLEGEVRELSVLFCDVKDFTSHAELMDPLELSALLDALLTPLTEVVHRHDGTIDKYMGDALMAFWGAPLEDRHHAAHAVAAAFEMQEAVAQLASPFRARGWPALEVGIGINTGSAHVGNMGTRYRIAYTAIGDTVNLAARLEALTRVLRTPIIVGQGTRDAFPAATYRELGLVQVKGKQMLQRVYQPLPSGLDPEATVLTQVTAHNQALAAYYRRDWETARASFQRLRESAPEDPLYGYYLDRIAGFQATPPPPDWRGELRFTVN